MFWPMTATLAHDSHIVMPQDMLSRLEGLIGSAGEGRCQDVLIMMCAAIYMIDVYGVWTPLR